MMHMTRSDQYTQSEFGKFTDEDAAMLYDSLLPMGNSRDYIDMLAAELVTQMSLIGASQFGPEQAREVVLRMICGRWFVPKPLKQYSFDMR